MFTRTASSVIAVAKCRVTRVASSSPLTTTPPRAACTNTSPTAARLGTRICRTRRYCRHATTAWRQIRITAIVASRRCEYSMIAWVSSGGIHRPKQVGHPGHPSPEPVARTSPPAVMSRTVEAVVAIVSFWKRVIVRARARPNDSSTPPARGQVAAEPGAALAYCQRADAGSHRTRATVDGDRGRPRTGRPRARAVPGRPSRGAGRDGPVGGRPGGRAAPPAPRRREAGPAGAVLLGVPGGGRR